MSEHLINFEPAPFWRKLAAMAYDSILILAIWMVVAYIVLSLFGIDNARTVDGEVVILDPLYKNTLFSMMILSAYAFFGWFWTHSGQTLGMQAWRIQVLGVDGNKISFSQSVIRFILAIISFLLLGGGYFYMLFNARKETLHDKLSGSVVVKVALMEKNSTSEE